MEIIGHRGAALREPENTLRGIQHALEAGACGVEIDVRLSRDRQLVVIHDPEVDRTTDGKGMVQNLTLAQLKKLDAGKGAAIPTLEETLRCVAGFRKGPDLPRLFIELKEPRALDQVLDTIRRHQAADWTGLSSFHFETLAQAKKRMPELSCAVIASSFRPNPVQLAVRLGLEAVHLKHTLAAPGLVNDILEKKLKLRFWTVNTAALMRQMLELKPTGIFTDDPTTALALERQWGKPEGSRAS